MPEVCSGSDVVKINSYVVGCCKFFVQKLTLQGLGDVKHRGRSSADGTCTFALLEPENL
jgi:hypothetical protein